MLRLIIWLALPAVLAVTGCKSSSGGASSGFASVVIRGAGEAKIRETATAVFLANGFESPGALGGKMLFEKRGTLANDIAYGGWIDDRTTRVRVKADIIPLPEGAHRLECQTYLVQHAGDSFFEEENKLSHFRAGPYQKLLDEIAHRLK